MGRTRKTIAEGRLTSIQTVPWEVVRRISEELQMLEPDEKFTVAFTKEKMNDKTNDQEDYMSDKPE